MPVGVPKIAFRIPGDEEATWVDLYNLLYRNRVLFLGQEVETEAANQIMGLMVFLAIENPKRDQFLLLNCPGGFVNPGISMYDLMQGLPPDIHTISVGLSASMGSFILVGGEITKRVAFPYARVMIHQPTSTFCEERTGEFIVGTEGLLAIREKITRTYVQRTGQPYWVISEDLERDVFMSATQAQEHGIVDTIGSFF
uniref:ATP-dependent Clp protease proteolytic subunit n=1 Tax=Corchorus capsularis TaxID=210143 RepID=A0A517LRR5_COCAP|nr:clp protease proteolytic subunit [Corchorus capsularis]QDS78328.1 clp protease proteolytic subunit [Corchorus capsularis]